MSVLTGIAETNLFPETLKRFAIRYLLKQRIREISQESHMRNLKAMAESLRQSAVALHVDKANEQHYEVPAAFFKQVLGPHLKYSSAYYPDHVDTLGDAEEAMLDLTCARARIADGESVLELGCGWGSLTLFMAKRFPNSKITAISNSASQKSFILEQAAARGLNNIEILTRDMNHFQTDQRFDRIVSVEMFEHMRNYQNLMQRISSWLKPGGTLFVHVFCHQTHSYPFETEGEHNWMGRYFFTGGLMPSFDLLAQFQDHLSLEESHKVNGMHYAKTSRAWLDNMKQNREPIFQIFEETYGRNQSKLWFERWKLFFMACEECFGYRNGQEWIVGHFLFKKAFN